MSTERKAERQKRAGGGVEAKMGAYSWGEPEAQSESEGDGNETATRRREPHQHWVWRNRQRPGVKPGAHPDPTLGTAVDLASSSYKGPVGLGQGDDVQPGPCRGDRGRGAGKGTERQRGKRCREREMDAESKRQKSREKKRVSQTNSERQGRSGVRREGGEGRESRTQRGQGVGWDGTRGSAAVP